MIFLAKIFGGINFYVYFCSRIRKQYGKKSADRTTRRRREGATYEEDENLHRQVKLLQKIDIELKQREKNKVIVVTGTELLGELSFTIEDE